MDVGCISKLTATFMVLFAQIMAYPSTRGSPCKLLTAYDVEQSCELCDEQLYGSLVDAENYQGAHLPWSKKRFQIFCQAITLHSQTLTLTIFIITGQTRRRHRSGGRGPTRCCWRGEQRKGEQSSEQASERILNKSLLERVWSVIWSRAAPKLTMTEGKHLARKFSRSQS